MPRLSIDNEDMAADGVERDAIGIVLRLDLLDGPEGLEVERNRHASLAVIGVTFAGCCRDTDAVRATRYARDIAQDSAVAPIDHRHPIAMRHVHAMRAGIEHDIVPAIRYAQGYA